MSTPRKRRPVPAGGGWLATLMGLGMLLAWAALAPLDEGVPAPGAFALDTHARPIQQVQGGRVKALWVREGDPVRRGQVLVTLDDTQAQSDLVVLRTQYIAALVLQDRLLAEDGGQSMIAWSDEVAQAAGDGETGREKGREEGPELGRETRHLQDVQAQLLATRQRTNRQTHALLAQSEDLLQHDLASLRPLADEGYFPRNRLHDLDRSRAEVRLRALQADQDYRKDVQSQLADISREVISLKARVQAQEEAVRQLTLRAPDDGVAMALAVHAPGDVVRPGDTMMVVVPRDEPLVLEVQVPPELASRVQAGLDVEVRLNGLQDLMGRTFSAKVRTLSPDRVEDSANRRAYYLARIDLTPETRHALASLAQQRIRPGLPVEALIKTGRHTLLAYLVQPLRTRLGTALTEH